MFRSLLVILFLALYNGRLVAEEKERFKFISLRINSSYVEVSEEYDDVYNTSILLNSEYNDWLKIGVEAFYTEWNEKTTGGGLMLGLRLNSKFELFGDFYSSNEGSDLPKENYSIGLSYNPGNSYVIKGSYRHLRFRNNQSVQRLTSEWIQYFVCEPDYFATLQLTVMGDYVRPGDDYGYHVNATYAYGRTDDWRIGFGGLFGHSSYQSLVDLETDQSNDFWGVKIEAGKYIGKNVELGLGLQYTDSQDYEAVSIQVQTIWRF